MKKVFYSAVIAFLCACSSGKEEVEIYATSSIDIPEVAYVTVPDTSKAVTTITVKNIAKEFFSNDPHARSVEREIDRLHTVSAEDGTPLFYIVNYKNNQGFIIVSATKDYLPVMAHSDSGTFDIANIDKTGVSLWLAEQKAIVSSIDEVPDSIKLKYRALWTAYNAQETAYELPESRSSVDVSNLIYNSIAQWRTEGYTVYRLSEYKNTDEFNNLPQDVQNQLLNLPLGYANPNYGGRENVSFVLKKSTSRDNGVSALLKTTWGQRNGYNEFIPNNYRVGCAAVAMGQIMKYHQYPATFAWSAMSNNAATSTTARFLSEIGSVIDIDYDEDGSSGKPEKVVSALRFYGYNNALLQGHSPSKAVQQLESGYPIFMSGLDSSGFFGLSFKGHMWVCDGYSSGRESFLIKLMTLEDCPADYEPNSFLNPLTHEEITGIQISLFHMNWGWYGTNDGYYADDDLWLNLDGESRNYAHGRKDIINIYPTN